MFTAQRLLSSIDILNRSRVKFYESMRHIPTLRGHLDLSYYASRFTTIVNAGFTFRKKKEEIKGVFFFCLSLLKDSGPLFEFFDIRSLTNKVEF